MLAVQIDTPFCTVEEFSRRSGIPENTVRKKIQLGELPTVKTNLVPTKSGAVYVNLLALCQISHLAAELQQAAARRTRRQGVPA